MHPETPPNSLNVFISYSVDDTALVNVIAAHLQPHAHARYWAQDKEPGQEVWPTIYGWIDQADMVVVVLTGKTLARAISVGNEVGYARKAGKHIVPLVGPDVPKGALGCLEGTTYLELNYNDAYSTLNELKTVVGKVSKKKAENAKILAVLGLVVLGMVALSD